jgi:hypothetical protein
MAQPTMTPPLSASKAIGRVLGTSLAVGDPKKNRGSNKKAAQRRVKSQETSANVSSPEGGSGTSVGISGLTKPNDTEVRKIATQLGSVIMDRYVAGETDTNFSKTEFRPAPQEWRRSAYWRPQSARGQLY